MVNGNEKNKQFVMHGKLQFLILYFRKPKNGSDSTSSRVSFRTSGSDRWKIDSVGEARQTSHLLLSKLLKSYQFSGMPSESIWILGVHTMGLIRMGKSSQGQSVPLLGSCDLSDSSSSVALSII